MMKLNNMGWLVAAAFAGAFAMSGFQGSNMKFASVDVEKAFNNSNLTKVSSQELQTYAAARKDVVDFLAANPGMDPADAKTYTAIALQKNLSDSDKGKLDRIRTDAATQAQKQHELITKDKPSADDIAAIGNYRTRRQQNTDFTQQIGAQYENDIRDQQTKLRNDALDKVRKVIRDFATKQGYTIVFSVDAAPYAANNITEEVQREVNKS